MQELSSSRAVPGGRTLPCSSGHRTIAPYVATHDLIWWVFRRQRRLQQCTGTEFPVLTVSPANFDSGLDDVSFEFIIP